MTNGLLHVYMGEGKGKTTAAFGLGMRCCGCGNMVYVIQFLKTADTGEVALIKDMGKDNFKVFRFESPHGFYNQMDGAQRAALKNEVNSALEFARETLASGECFMLILDEVLGAVENGLVDEKELLDIIAVRGETELVLTGRHAPAAIYDAADYVTEMKMRKHPYECGIGARRGIEY